MNTVLYWFSGTGNSLVAAKGLAERLGSDTRVLSMTAAMAKGEFPTAERVGLVFPVYAFGPPAIVLEFLKQLPVTRQSYLFAVATNGGMVGRTFTLVRQAATQRGLCLAAGWSVQMPGNCITLYGGKPSSKQQTLFQRMGARLDIIVGGVARRQRGPYQDTRGPIGWLVGCIWRMGMPHFKDGDKKFFATDACIRCGLCQRICPVNNIALEDGRPRWLHRCTQCMACIQWCPVEAIQAGRKTVGRARYRHPEVTAEELCQQHVER